MAPCTWDVDPADVCSDWAGYSGTVKEAALELATDFLWAATGRRFGVCPVTVRPAQRRLGAPDAYIAYPVWPGSDPVISGPYLFGGRWFNAGCASACCGNSACAIVLRGPVATIEEVLVDGEVVPPSAYRVDVSKGVYLLVRVDGACWPVCQDFSADTTEPGTFQVTYGYGHALPPQLAIAAGLLACEFGKSLTGGACALPARMTRLSRQGVEVEVDTGDPADGQTGIKMVDDVISSLNPSRLKSPPVVMSPDLPENCDRFTVVPAGS